MLKLNITCNRCKTTDTVEVPDSIPYCPKCGKPIMSDEINYEA